MSSKSHDLLYSLHDKPGTLASFTAAYQHMLASFVGIITPTLIIGATLSLQEYVPYLISMALFVSGVGTAIQTKRVGPFGSGLGLYMYAFSDGPTFFCTGSSRH